MPHKIALNFEDGNTQFIDADESESIADAAYRQSVNVPLDCTNGVCGTCKAFRQSGEFDPGSYIEDALSDAEAAEGYVLCCQAKAKSDMVIDILASSGACKVKPKDTIAEIVEVEALSAHRIRLSVKPLEGALPMFLPGQYVNVTAPNETAKRPYSFTSAPGADVATFLIRNVPGGKMSAYLEAKAKTGDRLLLNGPFGSFYLRAPRRPILFLAGGTGVGPILSMLEYLAARGANDQPVRLVYGVRDDADLVEVDRIEAFRARNPGKSGIYSYEQRKAAELDAVQERRFRANKKAWEFFQRQPPSYRKAAIWWVVSAKREETRLRRLGALIEDSERGRTVTPLTRPGTSPGRAPG